MSKTKINANNSIVAQDRSNISNSINKNIKSIKRVRYESLTLGFILGVFASLVANFLFEYIKPMLH